MASNPVGTMFVELDLSTAKYTAKQQEILESGKITANKLEEQYRNLGIKSADQFDLLRQKVEKSYALISAAGFKSSEEQTRAEKAKNEKIQSLNDQQFGKQTSFVESMKANWIAASVAIVAAWALVNKAVAYMDDAGKALQIESSFKIMSDAAGINSEKLIASMKAATKETVDDSDLMQKAVKLMLLDFDAEQIVDFSEVAITASQYAGTTISAAFDALGDAIANKSPKALRELGALAPEQMTLFKEAVANGATSTDVLALAVANLELKQLQLKGTSDGATIALQQFHTQTKEAGETIGTILIWACQKAYAVFQSMGVISLEASSSIWKLAAAGASLAATLTFGDVSKSFKEMSASFTAAADADFNAALKLGKQASANWTGIAEVEGKATAQELEGGKKKVASAMTTLAAYKDNTQATKDGATAAQKAADEVIAAEKKRLDYISTHEAAWLAESEKENAEYWKEMGKNYDEDQKEWIASLKYKEDKDQAWIEQSEKEHDEYCVEMGKDYDKDQKEWIAYLDNKSDYEQDLYKDLRGYEDEYYKAKVASINAQYEKDKAYYENLVAAGEASADALIALEAKKTAAVTAADIAKGISGDDFVAGINAGLLEMTTNAQTFGTAGYNIFNTFATESKKAFSEVLFQAIKNGTVELGTIWETFTDAMLTKFTNTIADMVINAIAQDIVMMFKANWTADSSNVLKIISGAISLWQSIAGDSGSRLYASGGPVPGHASGGDSYANDTVRAMLSPGEFVMPRSAVTSETLPALEYMRRNKTVRRYESGGLVDGLVGGEDPWWNDYTGDYPYLNYYAGYHDKTPDKNLYELASEMGKAAGKKFNYNPTADEEEYATKVRTEWAEGLVANNEQFYLNGGTNVYPGWNDWMDQMGQLSMPGGMLRTFYQDATYDDKKKADEQGWLKDLLGQITLWATLAVMTYASAGAGSFIASGVAYGAGASATGAAAGAGLGAATTTLIATGGDWKAAIIAGVTAAAMSAIASYFTAATAPAGEIPAEAASVLSPDDFAAWQADPSYLDAMYSDVGAGSTPAWMANVVNSAEKFVAKFAVRYAINIGAGQLGRDGSDQGNATFGYDSFTDNGVFGSLAALMGDIAPQENTFSFASARSGLDYVPYDNFPAVLHKGEAVLTKEENRERLSEADLSPVQVNFVLEGKVLQSFLYKQSKAGVKIIHERGLAYA